MYTNYLRQVVAANLACITTLLAGCWIAWASVSLKKLSDTEPDIESIGFRMSKYQISWMASLLDLGNVISPLLACFLTDKIGRKYSLIISSLFFCVPTILLVHQHVLSIYITRFSVGFGKGMAMTNLPLYISEISDTRIRGTLVALISNYMYAGVVMILFVGPLITMRALNIALCCLPFIFLGLFSLIPESPYYLAMKKQYNNSKQSLIWFRGTNDVNEEYQAIVRKADNDMKDKTGFRVLFTKSSNRRALFIVLVTAGLHRLGGITSMVVFGPKTYPDTNIPFFNPEHSSLILILSVLFGALTQCRLSDVVGRKTLLAFSSLACTIVWLLTSVYFIFPSIDYSYVTYILLIIFGIAYDGQGSVSLILVGELFPMNIKCQASALASVSMAAGSFLTNKFHLLLMTFTNTAVIFVIYALFNFLQFLFTITFVFETKCKTFEEIQDILEKNGKKKHVKCVDA